MLEKLRQTGGNSTRTVPFAVTLTTGVTSLGAHVVALAALSVCPHSSAKQIHAPLPAAILLAPATDTGASGRPCPRRVRSPGAPAVERCSRAVASPATPWSPRPLRGTGWRSTRRPGRGSTACHRSSRPLRDRRPDAPAAAATDCPTASVLVRVPLWRPARRFRRPFTPAATGRPTSPKLPGSSRPGVPTRPPRTGPPPASAPAHAVPAGPGSGRHHRRTAPVQHTRNHRNQSIPRKRRH